LKSCAAPRRAAAGSSTSSATSGRWRSKISYPALIDPTAAVGISLCLDRCGLFDSLDQIRTNWAAYLRLVPEFPVDALFHQGINSGPEGGKGLAGACRSSDQYMLSCLDGRPSLKLRGSGSRQRCIQTMQQPPDGTRTKRSLGPLDGGTHSISGRRPIMPRDLGVGKT
jgi:hypothetical protein